MRAHDEKAAKLGLSLQAVRGTVVPEELPEMTVDFTERGSLGLSLAIDGRVVSLVKNSQATRQSWLAANCHTCDCPGRSLCTCESSKALQIISVGREDTANVNDRAVLVEMISAHIQAERENRYMKARLRFRVVPPPSLK